VVAAYYNNAVEIFEHVHFSVNNLDRNSFLVKITFRSKLNDTFEETADATIRFFTILYVA
jgi:hypothetical protein